MDYFFYVLGGAIVGCLLSGWVYVYILLHLRRHVGDTRKIIERNEAETAVLRKKLSEFEDKFPDEHRSMWS